MKTVIEVVDEVLQDGTDAVTPSGIQDLEDWLLTHEQATDEEVQVTASVESGHYTRTAIFQPNILVVGSAATRPCVVYVKRGKLTVWTLDGKQTIEGPHIMIAKAGFKRVGYTETEVEWVNIFNVEDLEATDLEQQLFTEASRLLHKLGV